MAGPAYNVYCDESCHLERDGHSAMVLGGLWCPLDKTREVANQIRDLKESHGLHRHGEMKWSKIAPSRLAFYRAVVDYFFDNPDLRFRAVIVPDKSILDHAKHNQTHDEFYYKMFFTLLKPGIGPGGTYQIFLDTKDTKRRERKLHDVLCNALHDFNRERLTSVISVPSHEVQQVQLADVLIGAVSASVRSSSTSAAKVEIRKLVGERAGHSITATTVLAENKFNILRWVPKPAEPSKP